MKALHLTVLFAALEMGVWAQEKASAPPPDTQSPLAAPLVLLSNPSQELAQVNGEKVLFKDIQEKYQKTFKEIEEKKVSVSTTVHHFTVQNLVTEKIEEMLLLEEAKKKNISFSKEEFERIFSHFKEKFSSEEAYREYLQRHAITEEEAGQKIKNRLTIKNFQDQVLFKDLSVSEEELAEALERDKQSRQTGVWVKVSQILIYFPENAVAEEKKKILSKLEGIRSEIETGKMTFASAAKTHSEGASASVGGSVGWVSLEALEPSLRDSLRSQKIGALSPVVESGQSARLALLEDRKENKAVNDEARHQAELKEQCLIQKKQERVHTFFKEAAQKAKIEWLSF